MQITKIISILLASFLSFSCTNNFDKKINPVQVAFNYPPPPSEGEKECFPVASEGQACCIVVEPTNAPPAIHKAAEALRAYLAKVTGAPIRLVPENAPDTNGLATIHVGDTAEARGVPLDLPDLRYGKDLFPNLNGFLVKTVDAKTLVIRGLTEKGVAHGVVGFLKRYIGVRQYWECESGGLGEVAPFCPKLFLPQVEWRDWPFFYSRVLSQRPFTPAGGPIDFFRRNNTLPCTENYSELLPPKQFAQEHPEYFPLRNGKRFVPADDEDSGWQPCVSNPDVARIMAEAVVEYFRKHPDAVAKNVSVNDGGGECECDECRALDTPGADFARRRSARYIKMTNKICEEVAREFPSKKIVVLAYGPTAYPPAGVAPHRMILPVLSVAGQNALQAWDEWMASGPEHMGFYIHHDDALFFILPKLDLHQQALRIRHAANSGRAMAVYMETKSYWPLSGLVAYITAELLWDPRQDVDALLDGFYADFFGPASGPMKTFYATLEAGYEKWLAENGIPYAAGRDISSVVGANSIKQFSVLSLEDARRAAQALREAEKLSAGHALAARRVEAVRRMFILVEKCVEIYRLSERLGGEKIQSEKDALSQIDDSRRIFTLFNEASAHVAGALENTPPDLYGAVFMRPGKTRSLPLYDALRAGKPWPEVVAAAKSGADQVNNWLRTARGKDAAMAWWDAALAAENSGELKAIFQMARLAAGAGELKPLYRSKLDEAGRLLAPADLDMQSGDQEIVIDQLGDKSRASGYLGGKALEQAGLFARASTPDRSPFTLALARKDVPGNTFALVARSFYSLRVAFQERVTPGTRQARAGFLFKRNEGQGIYTAEIMCKAGKDKNMQSIKVATLVIPDQPDAWHEVAANVELPEDAAALTVFVHMERQAPEAKCWFANAYISEYAR